MKPRLRTQNGGGSLHRLRGYRFIALPHKYTGAHAGSLIDREQERGECTEAIREKLEGVMREEEEEEEEEGGGRKTDAGDSGCFGEERGLE